MNAIYGRAAQLTAAEAMTLWGVLDRVCDGAESAFHTVPEHFNVKAAF